MEIYYYSSSVTINSNSENITTVFFNFPGVSLKQNYNKMCHKNSHGLYIFVTELFSESSDGHNTDCETKLELELIDTIIMTHSIMNVLQFPRGMSIPKIP